MGGAQQVSSPQQRVEEAAAAAKAADATPLLPGPHLPTDTPALAVGITPLLQRPGHAAPAAGRSTPPSARHTFFTEDIPEPSYSPEEEECRGPTPATGCKQQQQQGEQPHSARKRKSPSTEAGADEQEEEEEAAAQAEPWSEPRPSRRRRQPPPLPDPNQQQQGRQQDTGSGGVLGLFEAVPLGERRAAPAPAAGDWVASLFESAQPQQGRAAAPAPIHASRLPLDESQAPGEPAAPPVHRLLLLGIPPAQKVQVKRVLESPWGELAPVLSIALHTPVGDALGAASPLSPACEPADGRALPLPGTAAYWLDGRVLRGTTTSFQNLLLLLLLCSKRWLGAAAGAERGPGPGAAAGLASPATLLHPRGCAGPPGGPAPAPC